MVPRSGSPCSSERLEVLRQDGIAARVHRTCRCRLRAAPHQRWIVEVNASTPVQAKQQLTVTNRCQQTHLYDVQGPDTLPWFNIFASERIEVAAGTTREVLVELQIDPSNVAASTYDGNAVIRCLDCFTEPGCTQNRDVLAVSIKLARSADADRPLAGRDHHRQCRGLGRPAEGAGESRPHRGQLVERRDSGGSTELLGAPHHSSLRSRRTNERASSGTRGSPRSGDGNLEASSGWGRSTRIGVKARRQSRRIAQESAVAAGPCAITGFPHRSCGSESAERTHGRRGAAGDEALKADPGNTSALNTLGNVYLDRAEVAIDANDAQTGEGLLERARSSYERSLNASPPHGSTPGGAGSRPSERRGDAG